MAEIAELKDIKALESKLDKALGLLQQVLKTYVKADDLMTVEEVASKCKVGKNTVHKWVSDGLIMPYYPGGDTGRAPRFKAGEVNEFYKSKTQPFWT